MAPVDSKNLTIRRHSRTTIEYSITDRPLPRTVHGIILLLLGCIIRLAAGIWGLLIGFVVLNQQWQNWHHRVDDNGIVPPALDKNQSVDALSVLSGTANPSTLRDTIYFMLSLPLALFNGPSITQAIPHPRHQPISALWTLAISATLVFLSTYPRTTTESLLVLHTLGLQTSCTITSFPIFLFISHTLKRFIGFDFGLSALFATTTVRFIPTSQIQDVLIHEAFIGWEVRYYLAVVVKGKNRTVVVFEGLLPRLDVVQDVWRGVRDVLWEDNSKGSKAGEGAGGDENTGEKQ